MTRSDNEHLSIEEIIKIASEAAVEKYRLTSVSRNEKRLERTLKDS